MARRRSRHHRDGPGAASARPERRSGPTAAARRVAADPSGGYDRPSVDVTGSGEYDLSRLRLRPLRQRLRIVDRRGAASVGPRPGDLSGEVPLARREPGRITIGTDPSMMPRRPTDPVRRRPGPAALRTTRRAHARTAAAPPRNMGNAVVAGLVIAAVFIIALLTRPVIVLAIIVVDPRPRRLGVLRQDHREGLPACRRPWPRRLRLRPARRLLARRRERCRSSSPSPSWPERSGSSAPTASSRGRSRTWPSRRWAWSGSACSGPTPR